MQIKRSQCRQLPVQTVERADASLQGMHDADLSTDQLRRHHLAESAGRYWGTAQTPQQFGPATATAVAAATTERLDAGSGQLGGGLWCGLAVQEIQRDRRMQLGKTSCWTIDTSQPWQLIQSLQAIATQRVDDV